MLRSVRLFAILAAALLTSTSATQAGAAEQTVDAGNRPVLIEIDFGGGTIKPIATEVWVDIEDGQIAAPGDELTTGAHSRLTLVFFEGSVLQVEHNTRIKILNSSESETGSTKLAVFQQAGNTWSRVPKLLDSESSYAVFTPSGVGLVRGTQFKTTVHPDGGMEVRTVEGTVTVSKATDRPGVAVTAGQVTSVGRGDRDKPE